MTTVAPSTSNDTNVILNIKSTPDDLYTITKIIINEVGSVGISYHMNDTPFMGSCYVIQGGSKLTPERIKAILDDRYNKKIK